MWRSKHNSSSGLGSLLIFTVIFFHLSGASSFAFASEDSTRITILHTNDLHSYFRPENTTLALGGVARLKTAIDQAKSENPNSILVDGGDWSEGSIYYTLGTGTETVRMMDHLGYDVAVIGNHDWLNGPDYLLKRFENTSPRTKFISANLSSKSYWNKENFNNWIPPYVIESRGGVKIAFIGLSTFERIFDKFFSPIEILKPAQILDQLSRSLKEEGQADIVVAISHNTIKENKSILSKCPYVDLMVGAHDHVRLNHPVVVEREESNPAWIVEAGSWGHYLGKVNLELTPNKEVKLVDYSLQQMDFTVPEDPETVSMLDQLDQRIEQERGPIFHDHVAVNEVDLVRKGQDALVGNLVTDAYLEASKATSIPADFAMESTKFIYGEIHPGELRTVDVFNAVPAIYNPETGKTWTLKVLPVSGWTLKWFIRTLYSTQILSDYNLINISGAHFIFDPWFQSGSDYSISRFFKAMLGLVSGPSATGVQEITIQGEPIDDRKTYRLATGNGIIDGILFFNQTISSHFVLRHLISAIPLDQIEDTQVETWKVLADYLRSKSRITPDQVSIGDRIQTLQYDLGVHYHNIEFVRPLKSELLDNTPQIKVTIKNYGSKPSPEGRMSGGPYVHLLSNKNGFNETVDPDYEEIGRSFSIRALAPGESQEFIWNVNLPKRGELYPLTVQIEGNDNEVNHSNDSVTRYFE